MKLKNYLFNSNVRNELNSLCDRLQKDYSGEKPFEQCEEDRIVLGNILDMIDIYEEQNNGFSIDAGDGCKLALEKTDGGVIISSVDSNNRVKERRLLFESDMCTFLNNYISHEESKEEDLNSNEHEIYMG